MPAHVSLTDPNLHEPKGVSTAPEGSSYFSNGSGSGSWRSWPLGKGIYVDSKEDPSLQKIESTYSQLLIDALGSGTDNRFLPRELRGSGNLWATNKITPEHEGDSFVVRFSLPVEDINTAATLTARLVEGASSSNNLLGEWSFGLNPGVNRTFNILTMLDSTASVNTNGASLFLKTDTGDLLLNKPSVSVVKICDGVF